MSKKNYTRHYEKTVVIKAEPEKVFAFADDHRNFSSHMNRSSWMMGGGSMTTKIDKEQGKVVGSHIKMGGTAFGIPLALDEVVIEHDAPYHKSWETVGRINLLVIDQYELGFEIRRKLSGSTMRVYIDYNLPKNWTTYVLGILFGDMYARWCVHQMVTGVQEHFK